MRAQKTNAFGRLLEALDELLFPSDVACLCCDRALGEDAEYGVCPACAKALARLRAQQAQNEAERCEAPEEIGFVRAAFPYDAQARTLVRRLKYESVRAAAVPLAKAMAQLDCGDAQLIVPVPTDERRRRRRGFNQATLLAQALGKAHDIDVMEAVVRTRRCEPQTGLTAAQRRSNLLGCMAADSAVSGKRVLLVDDVYTTGSTVSEAARALKEAGAAGVCVLVAARTTGAGAPEDDPFALTQEREKDPAPDKIHWKRRKSL